MITMNYIPKELDFDYEGTEWCPYCDSETDFVYNPTKGEHIICSCCGEKLHPCSLCNASGCGKVNCHTAIVQSLMKAMNIEEDLNLL